jgi:hypothetical protein
VAERGEIKLAGATLGRGRHVCAFFSDQDEVARILLPFTREGLEQGDRVIQLINPTLREDMLSRMRKAGIDADSALRSGQLELVDWMGPLVERPADWRSRLEFVERVLTEGKARGFRRTRISGEMGWIPQTTLGLLDLLEYEAQLDEMLERHADPAVCLYDSSLFGGRELIGMLRTHPLVIIGGVLHENPFHVPASELLKELRSKPQ